MRFVLPSPRHARNPLARIAATVMALLCLGALFVFGTLALAILLVGGAAWLLWFRWRLSRLRKQQAADRQATEPGVIEGEYVVIHEHREHAR